MAQEDNSAEELERKLALLSQNFSRELMKMGLKKQSPGKDLVWVEGTKLLTKAAKGPSAVVRLEPSLGQRLAEARGKAHDLEDGLQKTRTAFEDRLGSVDRMRTNLQRKEDLLVGSVRQIEDCLRSVLCMKREADTMLAGLEERSGELEVAMRKLGSDRCCTLLRKRSLLEGADAFRPARGFLERAVSDLSPRDLVEYFLVLVSLRDDLLSQGEECALARGLLTDMGRRLEGRRARAPTVAVSKGNEILQLKSRLGSLKGETARIEEQIDLSTVSRLKDDSAWYDVQRWIKKLHGSVVEMRLHSDPAEPESGNVTDMLETLKDFVSDAVKMVERLKTDK